jgi:DNA modification methylase
MSEVLNDGASQPEFSDLVVSVSNVPTDRLKLSPKNPRVHSKKQIRQIGESIRAYGFMVPVLVDSDYEVIAGHGRVCAAKLIGMPKIPTIRIDHLNQRQITAYRIADNNLTLHSDWNTPVLREQIRELVADVNLDISLESLGFEMGEIDMMVAEDETDSDEADDLPEQCSTVISRIGDVWKLGDHRVICGDALQVDTFRKLMDGKLAGVVIADPPYNLPAESIGGLGKVKHKDFLMAFGELSEEQFRHFLKNALTLGKHNSKPGSLHFVFMDWRHVSEICWAGKEVFSELKNICVWTKPNGGMGSLYRSAHELVFLFKNGNEPHHNNVQLGRFGRYRTNVWSYPSINVHSNGEGEGNLPALHPTVKPVRLVADAILDATGRRDIVLDPFLGAGTTLIAAEISGRIGYGVELDPRYVDVAIRRWQRYTGKAAVHAVTDETFNEFEKEAPARG